MGTWKDKSQQSLCRKGLGRDEKKGRLFIFNIIQSSIHLTMKFFFQKGMKKTPNLRTWDRSVNLMALNIRMGNSSKTCCDSCPGTSEAACLSQQFPWQGLNIHPKKIPRRTVKPSGTLETRLSLCHRGSPTLLREGYWITNPAEAEICVGIDQCRC